MTLLRVRATSVDAAAFTATANMVDAGDGTYGFWTSTQRRGTTTATFSGWDFSSIPPGSVINGVSAIFQHYEVNAADLNTITVDGNAVLLNAAARGDIVGLPAVLPTSIDVVFTRGNNTRSTTCNVDWLDVEVDYTPSEAPTVTLDAAPTTAEINVELTLTATVTGFPAPTLSWNFDGGVQGPESTDTIKVVKWAAPGTKNPSVTATSAAGSDQASVAVEITGELPGAFNGTSWVTPEVWNGTRWVVPEVWNGSRWVPLGGA